MVINAADRYVHLHTGKINVPTERQLNDSQTYTMPKGTILDIVSAEAKSCTHLLDVGSRFSWDKNVWGAGVDKMQTDTE